MNCAVIQADSIFSPSHPGSQLPRYRMSKNLFSKSCDFPIFTISQSFIFKLMKAVRIKIVNRALDLVRFELILLKYIVEYKLAYQEVKNESTLQLKLRHGELLLLNLTCEEAEFERFKLNWREYLENEEWYFNMSEWGVNKIKI